MNPYLFNAWKLFKTIAFEGQPYHILMRDIFLDDDFVSRRRFLLVFPDGRKRILDVATTESAIVDYEARFGPGTHMALMDGMVTEEVIKVIKDAVKVPTPVKPNVKLVPIHDEAPALIGVDFAAAEAKMVASLMTPSGAVYGPSPILGSALSVAKAREVMEKSLKKLAAGCIQNMGLAAAETALKVEALSVLYGGQSKQGLTLKGLATLERFGVALVG